MMSLNILIVINMKWSFFYLFFTNTIIEFDKNYLANRETRSDFDKNYLTNRENTTKLLPT